MANTQRTEASVWPARLLLVGYSVALGLGVIPAGTAPDLSDLLEVRSPQALVATLSGLLRAGLTWAARFVPLGLLAALSLARREGRLSRLLNVWLPGLLIAGVLAVGILVLRGGRPGPLPTTFELLLPGLGILVGLWLGVTIRKGWGGLFGMIGAAVLAVLVLAAIGAGLLYASLETSPLMLDPPKVTSEEKRRLYGLFKGLHPGSIPEGQTRTLRLSQRDLNLLLAWGLSLDSNARQARVDTSTDEATLQASARLPGGRYLNVTAAGGVSAGDGALRVQLRRLRLGRTETPVALLAVASPGLRRLLERDRRVKPIVASLRKLEISPDQVAVTYGKGDLPPGFIADLFHGRDAAEEVPAVAAHVEHLLMVPPAEDTEARFARWTQEAFLFAAQRSKNGSAVAENRAAILALGMLIGHPRVESFVGQVMTADQRQRVRHAHGKATLRGRTDWPEHLFVSAALAVLAMESVSAGVGLLKEELDADGGSGFSFGDLLADRSGTRLATVATRDEESARGIQARLGRGVSIDEIFPRADGLPEGIQDPELQSRYGGVGGPEYQRLVEEIDRRIAACAAYR